MEIEIPCGEIMLKGELTIPLKPIATIIFVHGSGSSRHSPRNKRVADDLNAQGFATLLFDLLTAEEASNQSNVFDIEMLTQRLIRVTKWINTHENMAQLPIGYFGASTGAAAALVAASTMGAEITAVVSRGGRVDLAGNELRNVKAPTLMIVGSADDVVLDLNNQAQKQMRCENELIIISGATHLFEEPGTLDQVSEAAADWFRKYLKH